VEDVQDQLRHHRARDEKEQPVQAALYLDEVGFERRYRRQQ